MEACTHRQLEEKNNEAVTRASSYGVTHEEPRVQGTYMHLGMHTAQFGCQQKEQATKRGTGRLCVRERACAPRGQPALLRFNSLSCCYC